MIALETSVNSEGHQAGFREPKWPKLRWNLAVSTSEAGAYGAMVGLGETYMPAFALALGMGEVTAGLVVSIPLLLGGILQTISLKAIPWIGSYKRWIVLSAAVQCISLIPLVIAALVGTLSPLALFFVASIYWAGGLAAGPAWNTWIGHIVPRTLRSRFFAHRTRWSQILTFCGFLGGGCLLQWTDEQHVLVAFGAIFGVACASRLLSVILLASHRESHAFRSSLDGRARSETHSAVLSVTSQAVGRGRRLIIYLVAVQGMVQLSGPFFTPYLLKQLHLEYGAYVGLVAASFVAKAVALPLWGRLASQRGARWLLWVGGVSIVPLASLWAVSSSYAWMFSVQIISGIAWAAYELGFFLLFFESMPAAQRARILTIYNLANTVAWCLGSILGGLLLASLGATQNAYYALFILSSLGRIGTLVLLARVDSPDFGLPRFRKAKHRLEMSTATIAIRGQDLDSVEQLAPIVPARLHAPGLQLSDSGYPTKNVRELPASPANGSGLPEQTSAA